MDYRQWLGSKLIETSFDWSKAQTSTLPIFLEQYTLHDSYWVGLWMEPPFETQLVISWDRIWLERREGKKIEFPQPVDGADAEDWPLLVIQLERVWKVESSFSLREKPRYPEIIYSCDSTSLSVEERLNLIDQEGAKERRSVHYLNLALDEPLYHSSFRPAVESWVEIWHGGETKFLCLDASGKPLYIPDI